MQMVAFDEHLNCSVDGHLAIIFVDRENKRFMKREVSCAEKPLVVCWYLTKSRTRSRRCICDVNVSFNRCASCFAARRGFLTTTSVWPQRRVAVAVIRDK